MCLKPDVIWSLTEKWKSCRADEPSELYRTMTKLGGALFALCGLMMAALPLLLEQGERRFRREGLFFLCMRLAFL